VNDILTGIIHERNPANVRGLCRRVGGGGGGCRGEGIEQEKTSTIRVKDRSRTDPHSCISVALLAFSATPMSAESHPVELFSSATQETGHPQESSSISVDKHVTEEQLQVRAPPPPPFLCPPLLPFLSLPCLPPFQALNTKLSITSFPCFNAAS
jgi:hypothetical protein